MSDLLQIFTGNPMSTFLGKKIEAATRPELESEDWALNIEICDIINENDDDAKDAARAIRKRLQQIEQDRNFTITNRTLTVLDTCVNNCSHRFHILVMTKDFILDLVKLIGPKNNPPIDLQERVLSLIESWAEAFRNQPDLGGVVSVYNDLKAKGVTFPPKPANSRVPIQTPQRTVPAVSMPQPPAPQAQGPRPERQTRPMSAGGPQAVSPAGQVTLEGEGYNKISQDLVVVQSSIEMFEDIMRALETPAGGEPDWKLADELSVTCRQMKDRIVDLIERIANEDLTIELLRLNDELNSTFTKYESLSKNRPVQQPTGTATQPSIPADRSASGQAAAAAAGTAAGTSVARPRPPSYTAPTPGDPVNERPKLPGVSSTTLNELSLIDFNASRSGDTGQGNGTDTALSSSTQVKQPTTNQSATIDPFSAPGATAVEQQKQRSLADELKGLDLGGASGAGPTNSSLKPAHLPDEISSVREQDFAEIENWLSTDSGRDLASIGGDMPSVEPISVPNSEFDNFIASRALAGASSEQSKAPAQRKPEPSS